MPKKPYIVVIDGDPGAFGLWVPDLPGCTAMKTLDVALPVPRALDDIARDPDVAGALKEGATLAPWNTRSTRS